MYIHDRGAEGFVLECLYLVWQLDDRVGRWSSSYIDIHQFLSAWIQPPSFTNCLVLQARLSQMSLACKTTDCYRPCGNARQHVLEH